MKIIVSSLNPVKINAVKEAFIKCFPKEKIEAEGVNVPSGISDQPLSEKETLTGAKNRVKNAKKLKPEADFWVGIEAGVDLVDGDMATFAWVVIQGRKNSGKARSTTFFLPKEVKILIGQGKELGDATDKVFGESNSKQNTGTIGVLTGNILTRTGVYEDTIILALAPFMNPKFY